MADGNPSGVVVGPYGLPDVTAPDAPVAPTSMQSVMGFIGDMTNAALGLNQGWGTINAAPAAAAHAPSVGAQAAQADAQADQAAQDAAVANAVGYASMNNAPAYGYGLNSSAANANTQATQDANMAQAVSYGQQVNAPMGYDYGLNLGINTQAAPQADPSQAPQADPSQATEADPSTQGPTTSVAAMGAIGEGWGGDE